MHRRPQHRRLQSAQPSAGGDRKIRSSRPFLNYRGLRPAWAIRVLKEKKSKLVVHALRESNWRASLVDLISSIARTTT